MELIHVAAAKGQAGRQCGARNQKRAGEIDPRKLRCRDGDVLLRQIYQVRGFGGERITGFLCGYSGDLVRLIEADPDDDVAHRKFVERFGCERFWDLYRTREEYSE